MEYAVEELARRVLADRAAGVTVEHGEEGPVGEAGLGQADHRAMGVLHLDAPALHGRQAEVQVVALSALICFLCLRFI